MEIKEEYERILFETYLDSLLDLNSLFNGYLYQSDSKSSKVIMAKIN